MGFLSNMMKAPAPGSRGAQFGSAMGDMAPLLFSMAQGLRSGKGAAAYAPQGLAAMMYQQQLEEEQKMSEEERAYRRQQDARTWGWRESERAREDELRNAAQAGLAEALGGYGGGPSQYDAMAATGGPTNAAAGMMALAPKIEETAQALGMDPVDLATIISYETAGTFDPTKAGPTTQWGQHRGLIQFGEPQARQYGVNWNDPVNSQLGADGAVARYFRENGWQPGMGMKDAYSIVNAGAPGRYSAKDAHNGGAPGTVAEKVDTQMAGHRRRAMAMFPNQRKQPRLSPERAAEILSNPYASEAARNLVLSQFLPQEQEKPQIVKGADGYNYWVTSDGRSMRAVPGAKAPDTGWHTLTPDQAAELGYDPAKGPYQIGLSGENRGKVTTGSGQTINVGGGPNMGTIPAGHVALEDPSAPGGYRVVPMEGTEAAAKLAAQAGKQGRIEERKNSELSIALDDVSRIKALVNKDTKIPVFGSTTTGIMGGLLSNIPSTDAGSISGMLKTLESFTAYEKLQAIRDASDTGGGVGQVSNYETRLMAAIYGELNQSRNKAQFLYNLDRFGSTLRRIADEGISDEEAKLLTDQILTGGDDPLGLFK